MSECSEGQISGSGATNPNPVFRAMPAHPDYTSAAAGLARTSSSQDRTIPPGREPAGDRSAASPAVRAGDRATHTPRSAAQVASAVTAAMPVTTPPL